MLGLIAIPAAGQHAPSADFERNFVQAADAFTGCLTSAVQMGMAARIRPETFKSAFAKMCLPEEAAFREHAIRFAVANGQSEEDAVREIDGNIANGRKVFLADHATYMSTGRVPR